MHEEVIKRYYITWLKEMVPNGWIVSRPRIDVSGQISVPWGFHLGIIIPQPQPENWLMHRMMTALISNAPVKARLIGLTCHPECDWCLATYLAIVTEAGKCRIVYTAHEARRELYRLLRLIKSDSELFQKEGDKNGREKNHRVGAGGSHVPGRGG